MSDYVFIPDDDIDAGTVLAGLERLAGVSLAGVHLRSGDAAGRIQGLEEPTIKIVDVVEHSGATLVTTSEPGGPPPRVAGGAFYPVIDYQMAVAQPRAGNLQLARIIGPAGASLFEIVLRSALDNSPVVGAVAHLRLKGSEQELTAVSDASGRAVFGLRAQAVSEAALLVEPGFQGHWGYFNDWVDLASGAGIDIDAVDLENHPDVLRKVLSGGKVDDGAGVTVGVIDTGVGPHRDLPNAVGDTDTNHGHGTHVAGIIAGRGGNGYAGVAPGVSIRSYRVFDDEATGVARNYDIHKAIERAAADGCHLINLSLKREFAFDPTFDDRVVSKAIEDATAHGSLCIAAAGNDFRRFVAFPARHRDVLAVSAFGAESTLPAQAYDRWTMSSDRGAPNADIYFTNFSNQGIQGTKVDIIGPGAGVVSTVPGDRYAPMSGTSMACPAAVGAIARNLSRYPKILRMRRTQKRYQKIREVALETLTTLGLSVDFEGEGMIG